MYFLNKFHIRLFGFHGFNGLTDTLFLHCGGGEELGLLKQYTEDEFWCKVGSPSSYQVGAHNSI